MNIAAAVRAAVQAMDAHNPTPTGPILPPAAQLDAARAAVERAQAYADQQLAWRVANPNPVAVPIPMATTPGAVAVLSPTASNVAREAVLRATTGLNRNIATNEPRLVKVKRHAPSYNPWAKKIPARGGRLYGLGQEEEDYQAPISEPEVDLIPVNQYDVRTGGRYQPLGEINSTLATVVGYGVLGLIVWGLVKGVRTR